MDNSDSDMGSDVRTRVHPVEPHRDAKGATREVADEALRRGQEVADKAVQEAQQVAGRFRDQAGNALGAGKVQVAEQIGGLARALKASSNQLRRDDLGGLADLSDALAEQVEAVQGYLSERSGEALLDDLQTFARRRRGLFVGSLLVAGLLTARFAQSQTPRDRGENRPPPRSATFVTRGGVKTYPRGPA